METHIPDLNPEQELALKKRYARELGVALDDKGNKVGERKANLSEIAELSDIPGTDALPENDEFIYTNSTNTILTIADLGVKMQDGFDCEVFQPFECKDLREMYRGHEIRKSRLLVRCLKQGLLVKGRVPMEELRKNLSPVAQLAAGNEGKNVTFMDPQHPPLRGLNDPDLPPNVPMNEFDKKLGELVEKDLKEDRESRKVLG